MWKTVQLGFHLLALLAFSAAQATELKFASIPDGKLAYVEGGRGNPVILVHGGLQDYRLWNAQLDALAKNHKVIAYSRRNHFPNEVAAEGAPDNAADLHGDDLAALVRTLNFGRVHIVAHSSGAHAALFFAARYPDMVLSLSLHEPPAIGMLAGSPEGAAILKDFGSRLAASREAFRTSDLQAGVRLFIDGIGGAGAYDRRSEANRQMMADNAASHAADATSSRPRTAFNCESARRISAPTLLTTSEHSPAFFHRIVDELERCLTKVQRHGIPNASHTVQVDNPDAYAKVVSSFLAENDR
jgi:non-heme chloroperoxidase